MILVEGPDGVGKTTLVKALARHFRAPSIHYGPLPEWWSQLDYVDSAPMFSIVDRYHWSALAYSIVHKQPWPTTVERCQEVDQSICKRTPFYTKILLYSTTPDFFLGKPKDDMFDVDQIIKVNAVYHGLSEKYFDICWDVSSLGFPSVKDITELHGVTQC